VEVLGLFHARMLRLHELALAHARWDAIHARLGITKSFYDRFTPAISARDFRLRPGNLDRALDLLGVLRP
jgi:hypothetical protein